MSDFLLSLTKESANVVSSSQKSIAASNVEVSFYLLISSSYYRHDLSSAVLKVSGSNHACSRPWVPTSLLSSSKKVHGVKQLG